MLELGADKEAVVPTAASGVSNEIFDETMAALVMLGFQKTASEKVVKALLKESPTISVEEAVRQALRRL
jgi:Holliday junction DNA helicase RuvA